MTTLKTPGVFIEEAKAFPVSIAAVATSTAAFVGYTQKAADGDKTLTGKPFRIGSLVEFERYFGGPPRPRLRIEPPAKAAVLEPPFRLHTAMAHFFQSGGSACWIVSVGGYEAGRIDRAALAAGLKALEDQPGPALVLVPDAVALAEAADCYALQREMLAHCGGLRSRFAILDIYDGDRPRDDPRGDMVAAFRDGIGDENRSWGAAYYPWVRASAVPETGLTPKDFDAEAEDVERLFATTPLRATAARSLNLIPPGAAMAGIYASVDAARGVSKAPANVLLPGVTEPAVAIGRTEQEDLTVSITGKSVNAIRAFPGEGVLVWGARTLDGNSLDWRYVSVRRLAIMLEESCRIALQAFVFEPNATGTWVTVRGAIENFLFGIWRQGGLAGVKPEAAFFVRCGLGETMTADDLEAGILRVEIGFAPSRPVEFVMLSIQQIMQTP